MLLEWSRFSCPIGDYETKFIQAWDKVFVKFWMTCNNSPLRVLIYVCIYIEKVNKCHSKSQQMSELSKTVLKQLLKGESDIQKTL